VLIRKLPLHALAGREKGGGGMETESLEIPGHNHPHPHPPPSRGRKRGAFPDGHQGEKEAKERPIEGAGLFVLGFVWELER